MLFILFLAVQILALIEYLSQSMNFVLQLTRFFLFILLLVFVGLRDGVGGDWTAYLYQFNLIKHGGVSSFEVGYRLLNEWLPSIHWVNFCVAFIGLGLLFAAIIKLRVSNYSLLIACTFLPFVILFTGFTRQSVGVGAFALFWSEIYVRNKLSPIWVAFGMMFHSSAILPSLISSFFNVSNRTKILFVIVGIVMFLCLFDSLLPQISSYLLDAEYKSRGVFLRLAFLLFPCVWLSCQKKKAYVLLIALLCLLAPFFSTFIDRLSYYAVFSFGMLMFIGSSRKQSLLVCGANGVSIICFGIWYYYSPHAIASWHHYSLAW